MEKQLAWQWASHAPILKALVSAVDFSLIVELGCGENSTPIFAKSSANLICVENNCDWLSHIRTLLEGRQNTDFRAHILDAPIEIGTKAFELSVSQRSSIEAFYRELLHNLSRLTPSLLFVDQYTCCRSISINILNTAFDVIAYHDCEPAGIPWYTYSFDRAVTEAFDHYYYKTPEVWTGVFMRRGMGVDLAKLGWEAHRETVGFAKANQLDLAGFSFAREEPQILDASL